MEVTISLCDNSSMHERFLPFCPLQHIKYCLRDKLVKIHKILISQNPKGEVVYHYLEWYI